MQCLTDNGGGSFSIASPQPTDTTSCVYVIASPSELQNQFDITLDEASQIMPLLALVLCAGFTFRAIAQALKTDDRNEND